MDISMEKLRKESERLEALRGRARVNYGIYGAGLLIAVIMAFLSSLAWAVLIGALVVLMNFLVCGRIVRAYRKGYRDVRIGSQFLGLMREIQITDKGLFPAEQLQDDGILPRTKARGVVRVGVSGITARGAHVQVADVALPVASGLLDDNRSYVILSGCCARVTLPEDSGKRCVCFRQNMLPDENLQRHFTDQGLEQRMWRNFTFFSPDDFGFPDEDMRKLLVELDAHSKNGEIVFLDGNLVVILLLGRYLAPEQADFKHPVDEKRMRSRYLPELSAMLRFVDENKEKRG